MRKKNLLIALAISISIFTLMFAEYRYIMNNLHPYKGEHGIVYIEIFGQVDAYTTTPIEYMEE